eukprot:gene5671-6367_t
MSFCSLSSSAEIYKDFFQPGIYVCKICKSELFAAQSKYQHDSPWPAFHKTIKPDSVTKELETVPQTSSNATAYKVFCSKCQTEIGHEFIGDGPNGSSRF